MTTPSPVRVAGVITGVALLALTAGTARAGGAGHAKAQPSATTVTTTNSTGAAHRISYSGPLTDFSTTTAGAFDAAWGTATLVRHRNRSVVTLEITEVNRAVAGMTYGAHLHVGPCVTDAPTTAGDHYNNTVVLGLPKVTSNKTEVWLDFTVTRKGTAEATAKVPFVPLPGQHAIVVHEMATTPDGTAGSRLACLPLVWTR